MTCVMLFYFFIIIIIYFSSIDYILSSFQSFTSDKPTTKDLSTINYAIRLWLDSSMAHHYSYYLS